MEVSDSSQRDDTKPSGALSSARTFFADYFWVIVKNVIGWLLIIGAGPIGVMVPGPGGIPLFLIGFAMVSFPGKRRLTARVLRGKAMQLAARRLTTITTLASLFIPVAMLWWFQSAYKQSLQSNELAVALLIGICGLAIAVTWVVTRLMFRLVNFGLKHVPRARQKVRPWMRHHGFNLLPPRRRRRYQTEYGVDQPPDENEILSIDPRHANRVRSIWKYSLPWLKRAIALGLTIITFIWIIKPIKRDWPLVREEILQTSVPRFVLASAMFAIFLLVFRVLVWRRILIGLGHKLPLAATIRIWSTSELARYVPGAIWQVWGRAYLARPYGVSGATSSTSQLLELVLFLLANILVAVSCLFYYGWRNMHGLARGWLLALALLIPLLLWLLQPKVFYPAINRVLKRVGKPPIENRLKRRELTMLACWTMFGLLSQAVAIWVITSPTLGLPIQKWWLVAGAYSLAWCAGFLVISAPGGLGVRELVFIAAMEVALPDAIRGQLAAGGQSITPLLAFLSVLLRLWATAGELLLAGAAYIFDYRGALGKKDAPGRVTV